MKVRQIVEKTFYMINLSWWHGKYSKQGTKSMRKIWGKENGGSFGLGRKSLGSDTDTETWS